MEIGKYLRIDRSKKIASCEKGGGGQKFGNIANFFSILLLFLLRHSKSKKLGDFFLFFFAFSIYLNFKKTTA